MGEPVRYVEIYGKPGCIWGHGDYEPGTKDCPVCKRPLSALYAKVPFQPQAPIYFPVPRPGPAARVTLLLFFILTWQWFL